LENLLFHRGIFFKNKEVTPTGRKMVKKGKWSKKEKGQKRRKVKKEKRFNSFLPELFQSPLFFLLHFFLLPKKKGKKREASKKRKKAILT